MNGYEHLFTLALKAENVARQSYQADAYHVAGSVSFAEASVLRALAAADEVEAAARATRTARGEESQSDAFADVLAGKYDRIAKPGRWVVYRDGDKVVCEEFNHDAA